MRSSNDNSSVGSPQSENRKTALKKDFLSLSSQSAKVLETDQFELSPSTVNHKSKKSRKRVRSDSDKDLESDSDVESPPRKQFNSNSTPHQNKKTNEEVSSSDDDLPTLHSVVKNLNPRPSAQITSTPQGTVRRRDVSPENPLQRFDIPEEFAPFPLPEAGSSDYLKDVVSNSNYELWLVSLPHDFNPSRINGEQVMIDGCVSLRGKKREPVEIDGSEAVKEHYDVKVVTNNNSDKRLSGLFRTDEGTVCAGPITRSMSVKRVVHIPEVERSELKHGLDIRWSWTITSGDKNNEGEDVQLIRRRRTIIGSDVPVIQCGYSEMKRKDKGSRKKKKKPRQ